MANLIIKCGRLVLPNEVHPVQNVVLEIVRGKVDQITPLSKFVNLHPECQVVDALTSLVVPGFIDLHVHGAVNFDTMDCTYEALESMSVFYARSGVTAFTPTTMTAPVNEVDAAIVNVKKAMEQGVSGAQIVGAHIEGCFISSKHCGAQHPDFIRPIDHSEYKQWFSHGATKIFTIAPELAESDILIDEAKKHGVSIALGHSDADIDTTKRAIDRGVNQATHTFNAMRSLHHREPGALGAILTDDRIIAQVIVDFVHVHPAVIKILYKCKGAKGIAVITDAVEAVGLSDGVYRLGGHDITVKNGEARLQNGNLAGSTLTMDRAFRNIIEATNCSLSEAVTMTSTSAARAIYLDKSKGDLLPGFDADVTILDESLHVEKTIVVGKIVYSRS